MSVNPYMWMGGLLAIVLCFGSGYVSGRMDGTKITTAKWQAIERQNEQEAAQKLAAAQARADRIQASNQEAMVAASQTYQEELQHVTQSKDRIIADLRAGAVRLRDPGTRYEIGIHPVPEARPGAGRCDDEAGGELSEPTAEFLVGLAAEADAVVHQLAACQAVVEADRAAQ